MPIYAYRCADCGHTKDVLQKLSDPVLTACPSCGKESFVKQLTAAGFQLKGSGWYVTDFRGGNAAAAKPAEAESKPASGSSSADASGAGSTGSDASASSAATSGSTGGGTTGGGTTGGACGTACACH